MSRKLKLYLLTLTILSAISGFLFFKLTGGDLKAEDLLLVGIFYMPIPAISTIIVEKIFTKGSLKKYGFEFKKINYKKLFISSVLISFSLYILLLAVAYVLGNIFNLSGVGEIVFDPDYAIQSIQETYNLSSSEGINLPSMSILLFVTPFVALSSGFTINAIAALGEELGWRGLMLKETEKWGSFRSNLFIGFVWGLWHSPILALGYNYGDSNIALAILAMCSFTIPFSFLLSFVTKYGNSVLGAAALHGIFNGFVPIFTLIIANQNLLIGLPVGIVMAGVLTVFALMVPFYEKMTDKVIDFMNKHFYKDNWGLE